MKTRILLSLGTAILLAACDRGADQAEAQRLAAEREALERDRAALAQDKAAAQQAANEQERARLDAERAELAAERARVSGDREAIAAAEGAARTAMEREKRLAAERRAADEAAARQEAEIREREARAAAAHAAEDARAAQTVDFFYDALDPYGSWVETDSYGYVFHPNAARDGRWRPYTDGAWVYTEYGWTWRSNEPFGWATYHYGRWGRVPRLGWVWVPNTEWGPAWVSWRRSDEYVGWAPLPPDAWSKSGFTASVDSYFDIGPGFYSFLRVADFGERTYVGRVIEPERNVTIINQTVNVTNVTYQKVQNNVLVVNRGPDITVINQRSRQKVPQLTVQRVSTGGGKNAQVRGNVLEVAAPTFKAAPAGKKPKQVSSKIKAAEMERGWSGAESESSKFRTMARQEATRAESEAVQAKPAPQQLPTPAPQKPKPVATPQPQKVVQPEAPATATPKPPMPGQSRPAATPRVPVARPFNPATPVASPEPGVIPPTVAPTPRLRRTTPPAGNPLNPAATPQAAPLQPSAPLQPQQGVPPGPGNRPIKPMRPNLPPTPSQPQLGTPPSLATPPAQGGRGGMQRRNQLKQFQLDPSATPTPAPLGVEPPKRKP